MMIDNRDGTPKLVLIGNGIIKMRDINAMTDRMNPVFSMRRNIYDTRGHATVL
jgi:hypothetical protein